MRFKLWCLQLITKNAISVLDLGLHVASKFSIELDLSCFLGTDTFLFESLVDWICLRTCLNPDCLKHNNAYFIWHTTWLKKKKSEGYTYSMGQALLKDTTMVAHGWLHAEIEPATFWLQALCHWYNT